MRKWEIEEISNLVYQPKITWYICMALQKVTASCIYVIAHSLFVRDEGQLDVRFSILETKARARLQLRSKQTPANSMFPMTIMAEYLSWRLGT